MILVKTFGMARDIIGKPELIIENENKMTVEELKKNLTEMYPELASIGSFGIAVNREYVSGNIIIDKNDEVAIIPPVSGG